MLQEGEMYSEEGVRVIIGSEIERWMDRGRVARERKKEKKID